MTIPILQWIGQVLSLLLLLVTFFFSSLVSWNLAKSKECPFHIPLLMTNTTWNFKGSSLGQKRRLHISLVSPIPSGSCWNRRRVTQGRIRPLNVVRPIEEFSELLAIAFLILPWRSPWLANSMTMHSFSEGSS